ncbi:unnamed protein product [Protopolystoma xenopodis]|uniref:Uncharacterized protein n=1 Tax=Protopolystoma xenopodis TaxID=117903 RepID=A0A3S5C446_9PLAT|nr:unnamed protein product [Protopolystoma xenopodis]
MDGAIQESHGQAHNKPASSLSRSSDDSKVLRGRSTKPGSVADTKSSCSSQRMPCSGPPAHLVFGPSSLHSCRLLPPQFADGFVGMWSTRTAFDPSSPIHHPHPFLLSTVDISAHRHPAQNETVPSLRTTVCFARLQSLRGINIQGFKQLSCQHIGSTGQRRIGSIFWRSNGSFRLGHELTLHRRTCM